MSSQGQTKTIQIQPAIQSQSKQPISTNITATSKAGLVTTPATTVQSVNVPGSKFSYIRLVTVTASSAATTQCEFTSSSVTEWSLTIELYISTRGRTGLYMRPRQAPRRPFSKLPKQHLTACVLRPFCGHFVS